MRYSRFRYLVFCLLPLFFIGACSSDDNTPDNNNDDDAFFAEYDSRHFQMGFTSWPYAPAVEAVSSTDNFIETHGDIYAEHIDSEIPWSAWMNDTELPDAFNETVANRAARRLASSNKMSLSLSLLNQGRTDLMPDFDGNSPDYTSLDDAHIVATYHKHVDYLIEQLSPDYLVIAVEVDGLLKHAPEKWEAYKSMIGQVKSLIKADYPNLPISESLMLHGFFQPDFGDTQEIQREVSAYINAMDFAAVSFYPFLKGMSTRQEMQTAFDFLHGIVNVPIAFAETGHLSEDLDVPGFNLFIEGNQTEQNEYMQTLLTNAQQENYEYVTWWTHRDYLPLWEIFPEELKDLGALWLSNGIIDEDGSQKEAYESWQAAFAK